MNKVLIIGGGLIGLSIARDLRKEGISDITILERGEVGREASYAAGGMLAPYAESSKLDDFFHFCDESLHLYPDFSQNLLEETGIDIELDKSGTLLLAFNDHDLNEINERFEWQKKAGLAVEKLSATEVHKLEPFVSPDVREGLFFPNDWQVDNRKLLLALRRFCELNDIKVIEKTEITRLLFENGKAVGAESNSEKFFADLVIVATGAWTSFIKSDVVLPQVKPIKGQLISFQTAKRLFSKVIYSTRGYFIPRLDGRILIGATSEDVGFDQNVTDSATAFLQEIALEVAPSLINLGIIDKWTGLRPLAADGVPVLGELAENLLIATGHYRNGILLAPVTAKIIAEKIVNDKSSRYFEAFSPNRFRSVSL